MANCAPTTTWSASTGHRVSSRAPAPTRVRPRHSSGCRVLGSRQGRPHDRKPEWLRSCLPKGRRPLLLRISDCVAGLYGPATQSTALLGQDHRAPIRADDVTTAVDRHDRAQHYARSPSPLGLGPGDAGVHGAYECPVRTRAVGRGSVVSPTWTGRAAGVGLRTTRRVDTSSVTKSYVDLNPPARQSHSRRSQVLTSSRSPRHQGCDRGAHLEAPSGGLVPGRAAQWPSSTASARPVSWDCCVVRVFRSATAGANPAPRPQCPYVPDPCDAVGKADGAASTSNDLWPESSS